jgi:non-heme chloroperoxidase
LPSAGQREVSTGSAAANRQRLTHVRREKPFVFEALQGGVYGAGRVVATRSRVQLAANFKTIGVLAKPHDNEQRCELEAARESWLARLAHKYYSVGQINRAQGDIVILSIRRGEMFRATMVTGLTYSLAVGALAVGGALTAQTVPATQAGSLPLVQFVAVEPSVKLEVLDWGGTGRPMILLAGLGNTAHVFEDLAQRLRASYHVYGITRRGFGRSSVPAEGYSANRLGDDVIAVVDSLHLVNPVLVGHSIAGEELSSVGSRHGDRVAGLVYLDAADAYAFYDTTSGDTRVDLDELRRKLDAFRDAPSKQMIDELLTTDLPTFERDLRELREIESGDAPPPPPAVEPPDRSSFAAFRAWRARSFGFAVPVAELQEQFEQSPDGSVGRPIRPPEETRVVSQSIVGGLQKFLRVSVPVLAIFAHPQPPGNLPSAAKVAFVGRDSTFRAKQGEVVRRAAPFVRVVDVPGANHYVFLTNEADVVREITSFVASLSRGRVR